VQICEHVGARLHAYVHVRIYSVSDLQDMHIRLSNLLAACPPTLSFTFWLRTPVSSFAH